MDKLMRETRQLAARYRQTTGTSLPVTGEIARFDAAKALGLKLIDDTAAGFDAIGHQHWPDQRLVIKGRTLFEESRNTTPKIGQINLQQEWEAVILVLFDDQYQPTEMYYASRHDIQTALERHTGKKKRGGMSVAQFKIIGDRVWTTENGSELSVWDNQAG
ncbi:hypothetical protein Q7C_7 [Methylophaga frappieri]|uniref:Uncharacterized protein n=2 Tax=Methylophaga frappieri (strain ATCC BAA-2434 / DSM 25690 / JAM7) TaxID=754477 RepID=I1YE49_METFJ|nr:hypothetical protein Q7C_7 [Methylophaga frappieri]